MKNLFSFTLCILFAVAVFDKSYASENPTKQNSNNKTVQLFNGKNLDGWYTFLKERGKNSDPENVFTVKNGMLHISGEEWGCITTNKEYENYRILVEFKWGKTNHPPRAEKARDSGLLIHSVGKDGASGGIWMYSIECQMIEGGTGDIIVVGDGTDNFNVTSTVADEKQGNSFIFLPDGKKESISSGRINWLQRDPKWKDMLGFRGENDVEKSLGEWNQLECIADGNQMTIFLNGKLVNRATDVKPAKGKIQIQSESAELFIRKIELEPLLKNRN
ncbi:DUF1080 domain-containing protein [Maribellus comscasis]|uniref:DUF1080 domain-containing protein n=1 Tax=Maribellus comscasis TaxID=2681766 RepID=A0A6I6JWL6_9BACT|nr:DUF1080 domain-containing protein [Maribellus comscasis]QGY42154.1 DUF1080 domain-containing protein [Maribellus comscasis]